MSINVSCGGEKGVCPVQFSDGNDASFELFDRHQTAETKKMPGYLPAGGHLPISFPFIPNIFLVV
jgi:hypothetical protein